MAVRSELFRKVFDDLITLRQGVGLTVSKANSARAIRALPMFDAIPADKQGEAIVTTIVEWLADYEHPQRRQAVVCAFALDPETLVGLPDDLRSGLSRRRTMLARQLEATNETNLRDREDEALTDLVHHWLEVAIDFLRLQVERDAPTRRIGLHELTLDFYRGVEWTDLFKGATELDIFFTYGRSWRRTLTAELSEFFGRPNTTRVILPDLKSPNTTALPEIAKRAGQTVPELRKNISGAYGYFADHGAQIWASDAAELYALYRFDSTMVVTLYNHQRGQSDGVPTLIAERGTPIFDWFLNDMEQLMESPALSRRISHIEAKLWERYNGRSDAEQEMEHAAENKGA